MTAIIDSKLNPKVDRFELRLSVAANTTSLPIAINEIDLGVSIALYPETGGIAKVQVTISPLHCVKADTAHWFDWALGAVNSASIDFSKAPISAIRCITTNAPATLEVLY